MKHKLIVLANWKYPREKTWSGTTYSLTQALSKYYDVEIMDLAIGKWLNKCKKLIRLPLIGSAFGVLYDALLRYKANHVIGQDKSIPVFEIGDSVRVMNPYFTYQDMTYYAALGVKELKRKHPYIYQVAGNDVLSAFEIHRQVSRQYEEYSKARAALFMSLWVKDIMCTYHEDIASKMFHIGGGTNIDVKQVDYKRKEGNKFLFIGRDFKRKSGDLVIEAFKIVKAQYMPNAELHMAGCQPQEPADGIFYHGDVSYQEVGNLLNMCDVFCMPSRFEAYGLVFGEALIFGLPCIGRRFFEMPHFIKEGVEGALINDDNPETLALKMIDVISDKEMIKEIQNRQADYIERYSWDSVARRAKEIIDEKVSYN